jgi:hypothetical protein
MSDTDLANECRRGVKIKDGAIAVVDADATEELLERAADEIERLREGIQNIIDYPPENGRRTNDGYPDEFTFDEFAYKRMVDSYRDGLRQLLEGTVSE